MLRITERVLRDWADNIGIDSLVLAEHDYRLSHLLHGIYSDGFLKGRLLLKGGTAINKLHLRDLSRLSVDLDFNQTGTRMEVLESAKQIRQALIKTAAEQDKSYKIDFKTRYEQTTIYLKYTSITGPPLQPIKIEVSHIERFPILKTENRELMIYDLGITSLIGTYKIEELLATKLRALYDRMKGRDLYDLAMSLALVKDKAALRKMFLYYFYRDRKVFNPKIFFDKVSWNSYEDDISGFVRPQAKFDLDSAKKKVTRDYRFIRDLDDSDKQFLILARFLLGENVEKKMKETIQNIDHPFKKFFDGVQDVNRDIFQIRTDEIRLYEN